MQTTNTSLASSVVRGKGRTYFFDLRKSKKGDKYVLVTESSYRNGQNARNNLILFSEKLPEFQNALSEIVGKM